MPRPRQPWATILGTAGVVLALLGLLLFIRARIGLAELVLLGIVALSAVVLTLVYLRLPPEEGP
jgi:predicted lysophospholipase L1 biosynthesis ABC-type transport system permease subunit